MKRQPRKREKMPANHTSSEKLLSEICKELVQLGNLYKLIKEWTQDPNRHFYKEDIQTASTRVRVLNTTDRYGTHTKTTVRHHFTSVRMAIIETTKDDRC